MSRPKTRSGAVAAGIVLSVLLARAATAGPAPHSRLAPLPSVVPPTPLHRAMRWSRRPDDIPPPGRGDFAGGRALLGFAGGVAGRELARSLGLRIVRSDPELRLLEVAAPAPRLAAIARRRDPRVRYVEPLSVAMPAHIRNDPLTFQPDPGTGRPYEWQFHAVGLDQALNLTKGSPAILVGVLDSGVSIVPDLVGKVAETFWDPAQSTSAIDRVGHGTFVASIVAARNDDGVGLAGFCGACRVAVYKAAPLTDLAIATGIQKLTDAHVRILNLSIVTRHSSAAVTDAVQYAISAGVLIVAASGNEGTDTVDFPASLLQPGNGTPAAGLVVGASTESGVRAAFSNTGPQLSLLAPGTYRSRCAVGILGAVPAAATGFDDARACHATLTLPSGAHYAYSSGTSFAVPEVSGVAALVWSLQPSLTSIQVASILEQTASRAPGSGWTAATGWGVLNARAAVENAAGRPSNDTIVLSKLHVSGPRVPGRTLEVTVKASWGDGTPIVRGATSSCRIAIRGVAVRVTSRLKTGLLTCEFTLPRASGGARVTGTVTVEAPDATKASSGFELLAATR